MKSEPETIRVFIPLTFRKRNGRPRILPPENVEALTARRQDPHVLRAIGRAWGWRRKLERDEVSTLAEIAEKENLHLSFVSRFIRLAYLSPDVLQALVMEQLPCPVSLEALAEIVILPWVEQRHQTSMMFGGGNVRDSAKCVPMKLNPHEDARGDLRQPQELWTF
jgi:hypothetical protein